MRLSVGVARPLIHNNPEIYRRIKYTAKVHKKSDTNFISFRKRAIFIDIEAYLVIA